MTTSGDKMKRIATALLLIAIGTGATGCVFAGPPSGSHAAGYQDDGRYYHEGEYQHPYEREYQRPAYWH
jgi:hypothetical protein